MDAILFDSRNVADDVLSRWEEMPEEERPKNIWDPRCRPLWDYALEDMNYEFEELKETLVKGVPEGDMVLLVERDGSESELLRPAEVFGEYRPHLCVYYDNGDIWIMRLARDGMYILSDCKALWIPAQNENTEWPEDMEEDISNLRSIAGMGLDASDTAYMMDMCDTKSLAQVFKSELEWLGVKILEPTTV